MAPFDGNPEAFETPTPVVAKPDVYSLDGLIAWLETQPADIAYCYAKTGECLVGQYLLANTNLIKSVSPDGMANYAYPSAISERWWFEKSLNKLAVGLPRTFGAALDRARALKSA